MTQSGTPWSDMEINQLKELAGQFSAVYIGTQIGRTTEGVRKQIKKLGLKGYVSTPPKPHPAPVHRPVGDMKPHKPVERPVVAPVKPVTVRKASISHISYPPLEWCSQCHSPVSNRRDHQNRTGCKMDAA